MKNRSANNKLKKPKTIKCVNGRLRHSKQLISNKNGLIFEVNFENIRNNYNGPFKHKSISKIAKGDIQMDQSGEKCLIKTPENCLFIFYIAQNRFTCIFRDNLEIQHFGFLDVNSSSILVILKNKELRLISQNGGTLQKISLEHKSVLELQINPIGEIFMLRYDDHLSFYVPNKKTNWTLLKKMFLRSKEKIQNVKFISNGK